MSYSSNIRRLLSLFFVEGEKTIVIDRSWVLLSDHCRLQLAHFVNAMNNLTFLLLTLGPHGSKLQWCRYMAFTLTRCLFFLVLYLPIELPMTLLFPTFTVSVSATRCDDKRQSSIRNAFANLP